MVHSSSADSSPVQDVYSVLLESESILLGLVVPHLESADILPQLADILLGFVGFPRESVDIRLESANTLLAFVGRPLASLGALRMLVLVVVES